jgi:hypothetical protein
LPSSGVKVGSHESSTMSLTADEQAQIRQAERFACGASQSYS